MWIQLFIILYFANLLLDYPLQGNFLVQSKSKSNYYLFVHSAIWGFGIATVLMYFSIFALWKLIMLTVGHYAIDYAKCRGVMNRSLHLGDMGSLYLDQALHAVQLAICLV